MAGGGTNIARRKGTVKKAQAEMWWRWGIESAMDGDGLRAEGSRHKLQQQ
jgi:hypothetical protein